MTTRPSPFDRPCCAAACATSPTARCSATGPSSPGTLRLTAAAPPCATRHPAPAARPGRLGRRPRHPARPAPTRLQRLTQCLPAGTVSAHIPVTHRQSQPIPRRLQAILNKPKSQVMQHTYRFILFIFNPSLKKDFSFPAT
jgi:hypothetical protein